jgi:hypothetical protein
MQTILQGNIRSVTKYSMESNSGISIFLEQQNEGLNENIIGNEILTIGGPYEMATTFEVYANEGLLPGEFELRVVIGRGAGGKAKLTCLAVKDPRMSGIKQTDGKAPVSSPAPSAAQTVNK